MKLILTFLILVSLTLEVFAQQNIGIGTTSPDSSAVLDITSTDKGILVPRMSAADRQNINNPALGLMVFDTTTNAFYYFNGIGWLEMLAGSVKLLADNDNDTKMQVEESADEDVIRFDVAGVEVAAFDGQTFHLESPGNSLMIGRDAGANDNGLDNKNVFIGPQAGTNNTEGSLNTAIGYQSMKDNSGGEENTAVGNNALGQNVLGNHNTAVGNNVMSKNALGNDNVAIGSDAMFLNSTGSKNVAIGTDALDINVTGNFNTAVGYHADVAQTDLVNATAIGANSVVARDSSLILGNAANVGIGTSSPDSKLHVIGKIQMQDGNEQAGYILTADSAGVMTWTLPAFGMTDTSHVLVDLDGDTKIQVEETTDEDIIRFDLAGEEAFVFEADTLRFVGDGSIFISGDVSDGSFNLASIAIGKEALSYDNGSNATIAIGNYALRDQISGQYNVAIGHSSMVENQSGVYNTAVGHVSLIANTDGFKNTAIGDGALFSNLTGNWNTGLGAQAGLANNSGSRNTFLGALAGSSLSAGANVSDNVMLGYESGGNSTGNANVFLGYRSGFNEAGSNKLYIENSGANQTDALIYGEFDNDLLRINGSLNINGAYQFPITNGTAGQVLKANADGLLTWQALSATPSDTARILADIDGDTRIQIEQSPDEDLIRFAVGGTEYFRIDTARLEVLNSGKSVFIGENAGAKDDLSDNRNTFIGYNAGKEFGNAWYNTALGYFSLANNISGTENTAIGAGAQASSSGSRNTSLGWYALGLATGGHDNVVIGHGAMDLVNTPVSDNVVIGAGAGVSSPGSANVFIGNAVGQNMAQSNRLMIDNENTSTPLIYGEFDNNLLRINGTLDINNAFTFPNTDGAAGQILETDGAGNVDWGRKTIDQFNLTGTTLTISLEDDGQVPLTVDLASIDKDEQSVDLLSLNGTSLQISLENDMTPPVSVDLASINTVQNIIEDGDGDTRIELIEGAADAISFVVDNTERATLDDTGVLRVEEDIQFGYSNTLAQKYQPPGTDIPLVMVCARIKGDDGKPENSGAHTYSDFILPFNTERISEGYYNIAFRPNTFSLPPIVSATAFEDSGTNRYVVLESAGVNNVKLKIRNQSGQLRDADFHFVAIGQR